MTVRVMKHGRYDRLYSHIVNGQIWRQMQRGYITEFNQELRELVLAREKSDRDGDYSVVATQPNSMCLGVYYVSAGEE